MADLEEKPANKKIDDAEIEDDEEESSDEPLGLLDKPVEILETRRVRKIVERLSFESDSTTRKKEGLDYSKGRGVKLGDIEITRYEINRSLATELKPLHKLLYKQLGKPATIKRNIYAFCGFPFEKESKEYADLDWQMEKFAKMGLLRLCEIFGLSLKGNRDELKAKVLEFLMKPYKSDKKVPGKVSKTTKKKSKKRKSEDSDEKPVKKKKLDDDEEQDGDDEEDEESEAEEEDDEEKEKAKKKTKEEKPKKKESKAKSKKATVIKLPTPSKKKKDKEEKSKKKTTPKKTKKIDSDSEEDEPLAKIPKGPSDEELERVVRELLDGADLETVTMKMICKQVFDKFPNNDLTERKSFIKETVKQIIS